MDILMPICAFNSCNCFMMLSFDLPNVHQWQHNAINVNQPVLLAPAIVVVPKFYPPARSHRQGHDWKQSNTPLKNKKRKTKRKIDTKKNIKMQALLQWYILYWKLNYERTNKQKPLRLISFERFGLCREKSTSYFILLLMKRSLR